jgi:Zn-dependent M28 family amino/carboxypeptidase
MMRRLPYLLLGLVLLGCVHRMPHPVVTPVTPRTHIGAVETARLTAHVAALTARGARRAGSPAEASAADYVMSALSEIGYHVHQPLVALPGGANTRNIVVELTGRSPQVQQWSAHLDSVAGSPGANDDASGVAVLLEVARVLYGTRPAFTQRFVFFAAEEKIDRHPDHHHYGSRAMAADAALRARLAAVTSLDMVGVGARLHIDNQGWAPDPWRDRLAACARAHRLPVTSGRSKPHSDHEAFEKHGIPAAYVHWESDPAYHTARDVPAHLSAVRLRQTAALVLAVIRDEDRVPKRNPRHAIP